MTDWFLCSIVMYGRSQDFDRFTFFSPLIWEGLSVYGCMNGWTDVCLASIWTVGWILKRSNFWYILYSPVKVSHQARNHMKQATSCWVLAWTTLWSWRWRWHDPLKRQWTFTRLHRLISQKFEPFITTTVRIPNPAWLGGYYSCLLFKSLLIPDQWMVNLNVPNPEIGTYQMGIKTQNAHFLENGSDNFD